MFDSQQKALWPWLVKVSVMESRPNSSSFVSNAMLASFYTSLRMCGLPLLYPLPPLSQYVLSLPVPLLTRSPPSVMSSGCPSGGGCSTSYPQAGRPSRSWPQAAFRLAASGSGVTREYAAATIGRFGSAGPVWTCMDLYGHVWTCMDMYGHVWTCVSGAGFNPVAYWP